MSNSPATDKQPHKQDQSILRKIIMFPTVRILLGIFVVVGANVMVGMLFDLLVDQLQLTNGLVSSFLRVVPGVVAAMIAYYLFVRYVEQRPVPELGLDGAGKEFGLGFLIGFLLLTTVIGILLILGYYEVLGVNSLSVIPAGLIFFLVSGFVEELVFRGFIFRIIEEYLGSWIALAISALLFGFLHAFNPGATLFSNIAIALEAGILLGAAYMFTRRLWLVMGLHLAWNFTQGTIFDVAVSGVETPSWLNAELSGPELLSGGSFGAEASILAVVICLAAGVYFVFRAQQTQQVIAPYWQRNKIA